MPASVVVPTLGRVESLQQCLEAVTSCVPGAAEILIVDQSGDSAVAELVSRFSSSRARLVPCNGRGVSRGRNVGIREAANEIVLVTDDDCTVAGDWVGRGWELMASDTRKIVTGQVLPVGDPRAVPSTKTETERYDFTGLVHGGALFPNNMALGRSLVLELQGFDERFGPQEAAEDNEFCYRWLKAGHTLRYEPSLVVWHHDWREPKQLEEMYVAYARGQGFFYAKHLRTGDVTMIRWLVRDVYWAVRGLAAALVKRRARWTDPRRGIPSGLPVGLWRGFRTYWRG
ncbi:MAG: glycosyltransferase family 2 protein [Gaiellaceae bacterium]